MGPWLERRNGRGDGKGELLKMCNLVVDELTARFGMCRWSSENVERHGNTHMRGRLISTPSRIFLRAFHEFGTGGGKKSDVELGRTDKVLPKVLRQGRTSRPYPWVGCLGYVSGGEYSSDEAWMGQGRRGEKHGASWGPLVSHRVFPSVRQGFHPCVHQDVP